MACANLSASFQRRNAPIGRDERAEGGERGPGSPSEGGVGRTMSLRAPSLGEGLGTQVGTTALGAALPGLAGPLGFAGLATTGLASMGLLGEEGQVAGAVRPGLTTTAQKQAFKRITSAGEGAGKSVGGLTDIGKRGLEGKLGGTRSGVGSGALGGNRAGGRGGGATGRAGPDPHGGGFMEGGEIEEAHDTDSEVEGTQITAEPNEFIFAESAAQSLGDDWLNYVNDALKDPNADVLYTLIQAMQFLPNEKESRKRQPTNGSGKFGYAVNPEAAQALGEQFLSTLQAFLRMNPGKAEKAINAAVDKIPNKKKNKRSYASGGAVLRNADPIRL